MKNKLELLSPVGSFEALKAAVFNGADAVYLGARAFGARANAGFSNDELKQAVEFAHVFGVRIYVTLNILIKENEIDDVLEILKFLDSIKVDALIVQDLGLVKIIKHNFPNFQIHASTQMSIHSLNGVLSAKKLGLDRVVLARECSLNDIKNACESDVDIEVFIHGAQCVSVSGQCLISSLTGGRSGNRGRCAQLCRLEYTYKGKKSAWLSPRDLSLYDNIESLISSGVKLLKIEGRLKSPEYVAVVTRAYREKIDSFYSKNPMSFSFDKNDLIQMFNRGNFTSGYAFKKQDNDIIFNKIVSHYGVKIGAVQEVRKVNDVYIAKVKLNTTLNDQDYLEIRSQNSKQSLIYSGNVITSKDFAYLRLRNPEKINSEVFRLTDSKLVEKANNTFTNTKKTLNINVKLRMSIGSPLSIEYSYKDSKYAMLGSEVASAQKASLTAERVKEALSKTAEFPFLVSSFDLDLDDNAFFPMSELNSLRRLALEGLYAKILEDYERPKAVNVFNKKSKYLNQKRYSLFVESSNKEFIRHVLDKNYEDVKLSYFPTDYRNDSFAADLAELDSKVAIALPHQLKDEQLSKIHSELEKHENAVVVNGLACFEYSWPSQIIAGPHLYVCNSESVAVLKNIGADLVTISRELKESEIKQAIYKDSNVIVPIYGRSPAMLLNHCPERVLRGLSTGRDRCELCDKGNGTKNQFIIDRQGYKYPLFPIHFDYGCLNILLEAQALNTLNKHSFDACLGIKFTVEALEEQVNVFNYYYDLIVKKDKSNSHNPFPYYSGRLIKGVE